MYDNVNLTYLLKVVLVPAFKIQNLRETATSNFLVFAFVLSSNPCLCLLLLLSIYVSVLYYLFLLIYLQFWVQNVGKQQHYRPKLGMQQGVGSGMKVKEWQGYHLEQLKALPSVHLSFTRKFQATVRATALRAHAPS